MNINKSIKFESRHFFELLICVFYTWYFLPIFNVLLWTNAFKLIFFGCFLLGTLGLLVKNGMQRNGVIFSVLAYFVVFTVLYLLKVDDASAHIRVSFIFWGAALLCFGVLDDGGRCRIGKYLLFLFIVTVITSSIGVITDNNAARTIAHVAADDALQNSYKLKNIASIYLFQGMVCFVPVLICLPKNGKQWLLSAILLISVFVVLLNASFTISLLVFVFAVAISLVQRGTGMRRLFMALLIGVLTFVLLMNASEILLFLSETIENEKISERLYYLAQGIVSGSFGGDVGDRWKIYQASLKTFLEHPFGVGAHYSYRIFEDGIGYHSQFLDDLARYGIAALAFYATFFISYYRYLKKQWEKVDCPQVAAAVSMVYLVFLIMNLGFRSADESMMMLFILPVLPLLIAKRSKRSHEKEERKGND